MSISIVHINLATDMTGASGSSGAFTATTAGNTMLLVINMRSSSTASITAITGLGTATRVPGSRAVDNSDSRACEIWQCLSIPGGVTSATITQNGTGTISIVCYELHSNLGPITLDAASSTTNAITNTSSVTGGPITTTGLSDFILSYAPAAGFNGDGTANLPLTYAGTQDGHGNYLYVGLNVTPQTYTPTVGVTGTGPYAMSSGAWKEVTAAPAIQPIVLVV